MDLAEEEQHLFPVYAIDITEETTRPLATYQTEAAEKETILLPSALPGVKVELAQASVSFPGLPGEKTPWPPVLRPGRPMEKVAAPPTPFLGLPDEKTPWPPVLTPKTEVAAPPSNYLLEIAQKTTQMLPSFRHIKKVPRRQRQVFLASVSGLLVIVLVTLSVLALHGQQPQQQHQGATGTPARATAIGQRSTPVVPTPVPTSLPQQPVQPFPTTLSAQIATLEAHDRLFYNGNPDLPEIALTFDDGPSPAYTLRVLAILKQYHVNATFFDIGRQVQAYPDLVRMELKDGNDVGNHTWTHPDMPLLTGKEMRAQIQQTSDAITKAIGVRPIYMRPPYGDISARVLPIINDFGLTTVIWNDEARDWSLPGTSVIVTRILNLARNGAIILLHDGGGVREQTVQALPIIIQRLRARGYSFVTMDQLIAHNHKNKNKPGGKPTPTPGATGTATPAPEGIWGEPGTLEPWWLIDEREKNACGC